MRRSRSELWLVVVAGGLITSLSLGARSTFGLFLDPVVESLGTERSAFAFAVAVQNITWGICQPIAGGLADRFGTARVLAAGGVLYGIALVLMANASGSGTLLLSAGFLSGMAVAAASFTVVLASVGRMATPERRSMALGVVSAAGSIGQFVLVPLTERIIDGAGWERAALVLAAVTASIVVISPLLRGRAADALQPRSDQDEAVVAPATLREDLRRAARSRPYLMLNVAFLVCGFHVTFIGTHLPGYVGDAGIDRSVAASALALVGLFNVFGSLGAGWLGGRFSNTKLLAGIYGLRAVVIGGYLLLPITGASTLFFGAMIGVLWLSTVPLTSAMVTDEFGVANTGTLFGIVFFSHQMGAFGGAWLGGSIADRTGSYSTAWWVAIGLGVLAMFLHLLMIDRPLPRTRRRSAPAGLATAAGAATVVIVVGAIGAATLVSDARDAGAVPRICVVAGVD